MESRAQFFDDCLPLLAFVGASAGATTFVWAFLGWGFSISFATDDLSESLPLLCSLSSSSEDSDPLDCSTNSADLGPDAALGAALLLAAGAFV
jgi:hypothetical protein